PAHFGRGCQARPTGPNAIGRYVPFGFRTGCPVSSVFGSGVSFRNRVSRYSCQPTPAWLVGYQPNVARSPFALSTPPKARSYEIGSFVNGSGLLIPSVSVPACQTRLPTTSNDFRTLPTRIETVTRSVARPPGAYALPVSRMSHRGFRGA